MVRVVIRAHIKIATKLIEDQEVAPDLTHHQTGKPTTKRAWLRAVSHPQPARTSQARANRARSKRTPRQVQAPLASPPVKARASRAVSLQRRKKRMD
jgi:hypothetical protein